jgi:hypothetical protein
VFWVVPLLLGILYVRRRLRYDGPRTYRRKAIWILPFGLALLLCYAGEGGGTIFYPETKGRLIFDLMFAYLPFVAFFGPLECLVGIVTGKRRFWHFPFTRVILAILCFGIGLSGVIQVDNNIRQSVRADAFLAKHETTIHNVRYVPPKERHERVSLAAYWADKLMVEGPRKPARMVAGFLNELAWASIFALDGTMLELPEALIGSSRKTVHGAEILGHHLDHRELLSVYLAIFGFGVGIWQILMVYERFRMYSLAPVPLTTLFYEYRLRRMWRDRDKLHVEVPASYRLI